MDEPEAALSTQNCLTCLRRIHELVNDGSQFVIATHSPIILAYPEATIFDCTDTGLMEIDYEDANPVRLTQASSPRETGSSNSCSPIRCGRGPVNLTICVSPRLRIVPRPLSRGDYAADCPQANGTELTARVVGVLGMRSCRVASGSSCGKNLNSPDIVWRLEPSQVPR